MKGHRVRFPVAGHQHVKVRDPVSRCQAEVANLLIFFTKNDLVYGTTSAVHYLGPQYLRLHKLPPCPRPDPPANTSEL